MDWAKLVMSWWNKNVHKETRKQVDMFNLYACLLVLPVYSAHVQLHKP